MPMRRPRPTTAGLPAISHPIKADAATMALIDELNGWRNAGGKLVRPGDNLQAVIAQSIAGETIVLLPGTHQRDLAAVVDKAVRIVGLSATIMGPGTLLDVTGADAEIIGLRLVRTGRAAAQGAIRLAGTGGRVWGCTVESAAPAGIRVEGDYCAVQDCKFAASTAAVAGDADVYWADGATFGICCGSLWGRTAGTFALDYRAIDQMTEAANGVAAIINVR